VKSLKRIYYGDPSPFGGGLVVYQDEGHHPRVVKARPHLLKPEWQDTDTFGWGGEGAQTMLTAVSVAADFLEDEELARHAHELLAVVFFERSIAPGAPAGPEPASKWMLTGHTICEALRAGAELYGTHRAGMMRLHPVPDWAIERLKNLPI
jgi:hypothetical protein